MVKGNLFHLCALTAPDHLRRCFASRPARRGLAHIIKIEFRCFSAGLSSAAGTAGRVVPRCRTPLSPGAGARSLKSASVLQGIIPRKLSGL
jgi:hypothetical protein